jgi:hypothetical protein
MQRKVCKFCPQLSIPGNFRACLLRKGWYANGHVPLFAPLWWRGCTLVACERYGSAPSPVSMKGENIVVKAISQGFDKWITQKLLDFQQRVKVSVAKTPICPSTSIRIAEEKR